MEWESQPAARPRDEQDWNNAIVPTDRYGRPEMAERLCHITFWFDRLPCESSVSPAQPKRRYVALSMYHPLLLQALECNKTRDYRREGKGSGAGPRVFLFSGGAQAEHLEGQARQPAYPAQRRRNALVPATAQQPL